MTKALISLRVILIATCLDSIILYSIIHTNYKWMHEWFTLFEIDKKYIQPIYNDGHNILILYQFPFHHKWSEGWSLVISMVHMSCLTSCGTI